MANPIDNLKPFKPGHKKLGGKQKGYTSPTAELKRLLEKKISYEDPESKKQVTGKISTVIALRGILNACQGDQNAIEDILDRIDGKPSQKVVSEMEGKITVVVHNARESGGAKVLPTSKPADDKR